MTPSRLRVAVFASGRGSNFQSILDAVDAGDLDIDVVCCISDRETAGALDRASKRGVPVAVLHPDAYEDSSSYADALLKLLEKHAANFIALAGYLKKVPAPVVRRFPNRILNIHPTLLPAFGGKGMYGGRVHEAVVDYGVHWTGATVHLVEDAYDTGPIVLQEPVPVYPDDTPGDVAARVLKVEHRLYPEALRLFAQGRIDLDGRRVRILPPQSTL
ncbi:MAG: phosphoribosylglycinamide formyltransferase [Rhodothermales bacterium]